MSVRFGRDYKLTIGLGSEAVEIVPPFEISFSALENIQNRALNKMNISIKGLKQSTRLKLIKYELDVYKYLPIKLEVGYRGRLYQAFKGSVKIGEMKREGATWASVLECADGWPAFNNAFTSKTVKGRKLAIETIVGDMENVDIGAVTELTETIRPKVLVGAGSELLATISQGKEMYIKDEKLYVFGSDDVGSAVAPLVSALTGLVDTPVEDHIETTFNTILNPTLRIGGLCVIESITNPSINGTYKVYQISTNGEYKGENWSQTVTCRKANNYKVVR